jgi:Eco57I restriction-modification methylase
MPVNLKNLRAAIHDFAWDKVFRASLKWTKPTDNLRVEVVDTQHYTLTPIADTGGMQVYVVRSAEGTLPPRPTRNKIETRLRRTQVEHLLIFEDATQQVAVIQWVKRGQQGRRVREFTYRRGDSGEALIQKLQGIAFEIGDFDPQGRIEISKVTARVSKNLDVEGVTKKFYEEFKRQREEFQTFLAGIPLDSDQRWYVSVMLNRLMFISFIQAKGFLNHNPDYLRERLAWSKATLGPDRYYRGFLRILFFQGFALEPGQRGADVHQMLGTIPYLNGGLFLPHPIEEQYGDAIDIPDSAFDTLLAFFSLWRWHLSERPGTSDREIDPDVLGYIFEKYINQKQMGAYYTRDDITGYICRNTIIPALFDKADLSLAPLDLPHTIADYLYPAMRQEELLPTESEREQVARHSRVAALIADAHAGTIATINDAVTANLDLESLMGDLIPQLDAPTVYRLYTTLAGDPYAGKLPLSILDPTAGSGAFLFAALRILTPIYAAVLDRMEELVEQKQAVSKPMVEVLAAAEAHANRDYFITKSIVVRNLYGVDLMAEATEICKLRLFLRMVADLDEAKHIEPLPDIDFNIRAGNALVGYARPEEIGLVYKDKIAGLNARQQRLLEEIKAVQRELTDYRNAQLQFNPSAAEGHAAREQIRERLDTLNAGLDTDLIKIGQIRTEADGSSNTHPFHWFTAFYEIISEGGFDVIVGNPPYVEYSKVRGDRKIDGEDRYKIYGYKTEGAGNLYAFSTERSFNLLKDGGWLGFIVQQPVVSTQRMRPIRSLLAQNATITLASTYDDRPSKLFDGINHARVAILLSRKQMNSHGANVFTTKYHKWYSEERFFLFEKLVYIPIQCRTLLDYYPKLGTQLEVSVFNKLDPIDRSLSAWLSSQDTEHRVYFKITGVGHWMNIMTRPPKFYRAGVESSSSREEYVCFPSEASRDRAFVLMNSTLFYWFYQARTNCRDFNPSDYKTFPVPRTLESADFTELASRLRDELDKSAVLINVSHSKTGNIQVETFSPRQSKPIIDDIDRTLATHYGFTDEELDFIINYDIKYRMGRDAGDGGDEE